MITEGAWELDIYPHCPVKFKEKDIKLRYFIEFDKELFECKIVVIKHNVFTYIHRKTTELRKPNEDIIYSTNYDSRWNWSRCLTKPKSKTENLIWNFFKYDRVYYSSNEVGDAIHNYIMWCNKR